MSTLRQQLDVERNKISSIVPQLSVKQQSKKFSNRKFTERPKSLGSRIPDGLLIDEEGKETTLLELLNNQPGIISFYRGAWCKFCDLEMKAYKDLIQEKIDDDLPLILISPDSPEASLESDFLNDLNIKVYSDPHNKLADDFNLVIKVPKTIKFFMKVSGINLQKIQNNKNVSLPIPATYVVDGNGLITNAWIDPDFTHRAEPLEVYQAYKEVMDYSK